MLLRYATSTGVVVLLILLQLFHLGCGESTGKVRVELHLARLVEDSVIEEQFVQRSTPGSDLFRQHLTVASLTTLVRGRPESLALAIKYLHTIGAENVYLFTTQDVVSGEVPAASPAALSLAVPARLFGSGARREILSVPPELRGHVIRIIAVPASYARETRRLRSEPGMQQTPATIRQRYAVPSTPLTNSSAATQGVGEFQQSYFNTTWITTFETQNNLTHTGVLVHGPNSPSTDDVEGTLDLEYIIAMAPGATTWWVSANDTSNNPYGIDFAWWCDEVIKLSPMPLVVSLSWGLGEAQYYLQSDIMVADNDAFRKLGLLGVSIMVASGDSGPGGRSYVSCSHFDPSWPASSSYVTAVGATYANAINETEVAVNWSGGGFSDYFPRPAWQEEAVSLYFKEASSQLPKPTFYNASGRGFPDVAALGTNFLVYGDSGYGTAAWYQVSGTSCASPTFAGIITRINGLRAAKGKPSLGFLNPALYKMGNIGVDVTQGQNLDDDCFGIFTIAGFPAAKGWDPVSGLGTPRFDVLSAGLLKD